MKLMQKAMGVGILCIALNACKKDSSSSTTTTVKDVDGNEYHVVKIGDKYWTVENAQMTHFRNGDTIKEVQKLNEWGVGLFTEPAWCYYDSTASADPEKIYGKLYNCYTINHKGFDGKPDFAPVGWHVPDTAEVNALIVALGGTVKNGGDTTVGGKLKEAGTKHWANPNKADNSSGFTALPAGFRSANGNFVGKNKKFNFWSSTLMPMSTNNAYYYYLINEFSRIDRDNSNFHAAYSVRFVKD